MSVVTEPKVPEAEMRPFTARSTLALSTLLNADQSEPSGMRAAVTVRDADLVRREQLEAPPSARHRLAGRARTVRLRLHQPQACIVHLVSQPCTAVRRRPCVVALR